MDTVSSEEVKHGILEYAAAQEAYTEAQYRRRIASRVATAMEEKSTSYRQLVDAMNSSHLQVQRLLNKQRGGSLTLLTLIKASRALGLHVEDMLS